ncbi:MAG: M14 family metallopeptidase [Alphaproteobacteria bacterium]|nr:M14 family metallopeptidase [Alphaproteobacteria bacterium]
MPRQTETIPLLSPAPGTDRRLVVHRYGDPTARPRAYLHTALHADEWPGLLVLQKLIGLLDQADGRGEINGSIILVPYANPIGLAQRLGGHLAGRYAFDGSGNFNRDWPDLAEAASARLTEPLPTDPAQAVAMVRAALKSAVAEMPRRTPVQELRAILLGLSIDADLVLDLHCDSEALFHTYANFRHEAEATQLGAEFEAPVTLLEDDAGGGAFDAANAQPWWTIRNHREDAAHLPPACFGVTVELRGSADVDEAYAEHDAAALFRFLQRRTVIAGDPGPAPDLPRPPSRLEAVGLLRAPHAGVAAYRKRLGDWVDAGETVAMLHDPAARDPKSGATPIVATTSGLLFSRLNAKFVEPGESIGKIAGSEPLTDRIQGALLED